jgi:hypothetical protein
LAVFRRGAGQANEAYNPVAEIWTTLKAMPVGRRGGSIGVRSNKVYLVGGIATGV